MIEVISALFLSTLLLIGLQQVIVGFKNQSTAIKSVRTPQAWKQRLRNRIEWDIKNSRQIQILENGFILTGFASRDENGLATHYRSTIRYRFLDDHMIRQSRVIDGSPNIILQRQELMAVGTTKILVGRIEDTMQDLLIPPPEQQLINPLTNSHKVYILNEEQLLSEFVVFR